MIEKKVLVTIRSHDMLKKGDKVILGVSGGVDSIALLHILNSLKKELNVQLYVAHLNHMIRGRASDRDAEFVRQMSKKLRIPLIEEKIDVPRYALLNKFNLEDAARRARYDFFNRVAEKVRASKVAVAHNADDNIETFMMRLIRGAGTRGLTGIPAVRGRIIRPLIGIWRSELEDYLGTKGAKHRTDDTNFDTRYLRNRIRRVLIPTLKKYNTNIKEILLRTINTMNNDHEYIEKSAQRFLKKLTSVNKEGEMRLSNKGLMRLDPSLKAETLRLAIESVKNDLTDVTYSHIDDILRQAGKKSGEVHLPGAYVYLNNKEIMIRNKRITIPQPESFVHILNVPGRVRAKNAGFLIKSKLMGCVPLSKIRKKDPYRAYIDYDKISRPLIVRSRKPGDAFRPLGLKGKKKLQDIFVDSKVDIYERDKVPVIEDGKDIVWVVGYRMSEKAKVTDSTKKVLMLSASKG